jgi:hypothetical protein
MFIAVGSAASLVLSPYSTQSAIAQGSLAAAECAQKMRSYMGVQQQIDLCKNGGTLETAECAQKMRSYMDVQQQIDLCRKY